MQLRKISNKYRLNPESIPSFKIPKYIRQTARVLNTISVSWATKFALAMFFKPLPFPIPEREKEMRSQAIKHELLTKNAKEFLVFELKADGPKVLMIHGWSGRASQFHEIASFLHNKGFHIFAVEAPEHGELQGHRTHMLSFVDALEESCKRFGEFDFAIGHSLGGMALFNVLSRNQWFEKMVIMGSPANISNVIHDFCEKVNFDDRVADGIISYIEKKYSLKEQEASSDYLCQIYRPEGLIIHDLYDQDVPVENARIMHDKWRGSKYIETEGLGHRRVLRDPKVMAAIYDFFKN